MTRKTSRLADNYSYLQLVTVKPVKVGVTTNYNNLQRLEK
jgi:hypothetical protein